MEIIMKKSSIFAGFIIILMITQFGFILYLNNAVKNLDNTTKVLDRTLVTLANELNLTKGELEGKIEESYTQSQEQISKLTSDVIMGQESLEEELSEIKASTSADFSGIIEKAIKSVVSIKTDVSQGSGFIINEEGYIVTNTHVLSGASYVKAQTYEGGLKDAELIGYNSEMDVALLKISGNYDYLRFTDSDDAEVGEKVIAIGNPYGLSFSVTEGIISALDRSGPAGSEAYIQISVPLNPGNSGGPLINKKGKVVGINNFKVGGAESLGFALESNYAVDVINAIAEDRLGEIIV